MRLFSIVALLLALHATAAAAAGPTGLEVRVLDCGTMRGMDAAPFLPDMDDRPARIDMVNRCFLIEHPEGKLLWDVGFPVGWTWNAMAWMYWLFTFGRTSITPAEPLVTQLDVLGLVPSDIDYVAFSHSHFDHVGQSRDFTESTWLVQKIERDWLYDPELENDSIQPELLEAMRAAKAVELEGDYDVFGDGSVVILSAPGHTPGHQCLFLDLPQTGPVVLSGDLYHSLLNRERREPPDFNTDRDETRESMERIETFLATRGAQLWIQHAPESGPQAPARLR